MKSAAARLMIAGLEQLASGGALADGLGRTLPRSELPAPCSGFFCSGNTLPQTPLGGPEPLPRVDAWSRFVPAALAPRTASSPFPFDAGPAYSMDRADRLARPPRSTASRESF